MGISSGVKIIQSVCKYISSAHVDSVNICQFMLPLTNIYVNLCFHLLTCTYYKNAEYTTLNLPKLFTLDIRNGNSCKIQKKIIYSFLIMIETFENTLFLGNGSKLYREVSACVLG